MKNYSKVLTCILILTLTACQGTLKLGKRGEIEKGRVLTKCTKPQKRYTKSVDAAVKGSVKAWKSITDAELSGSIKTEVIKLTDYSQEGLDLDLVLFRICQMSNNKTLNSQQSHELITLAMKTWNNKMSINEQKTIIAQLNVELISNLKTANELKLNTETILSKLYLL